MVKPFAVGVIWDNGVSIYHTRLTTRETLTWRDLHVAEP